MFSHEIDKNLKLSLPELWRAEDITSVVRSNLNHLQPWMPWAVDDYSVESAKEWIQRTLSEFAEDGRFNAIILIEENVVVTIGFQQLNMAHSAAAQAYLMHKPAQDMVMRTYC